MQSRTVELGTLASPDSGRHPGIVLVHDVWGLADHTRDLAGRFAAEGFCTLALDLYRHKGDVEITDPGVWLRSLSDPEAIADVRAAVAFLAARPEAAGESVAVVGFCMGGTVALLAACALPELSAAVAFYGLLSHAHGLLYDEHGLDPELKPRSPLEAAGALACPTLCLFGDSDAFVPMSDIELLREQLAVAPAESEIVVYPGVGHAFMNDTRKDAYAPEVARKAWQRTLAFLRMQLSVRS